MWNLIAVHLSELRKHFLNTHKRQALSVTRGNRFCVNKSLLQPKTLRNHWLNEGMTPNRAHLFCVSVYLECVL